LIEPQLSSPVCSAPLTHWLVSKDEFSSVASHISIDWLDKYCNASPRLLTPIFEAAVKYADREELESLILKVSRDILCDWRDNPDKDLVDFWLIRNFYFIEDISLDVVDWLGSNPDNILILESFSGRFVFNDYGGKWPDLSALKIYQVMDVFCEAWPKVYLPSHWGTGDPDSEKAYRFLTDLVWGIEKDIPGKRIEVLGMMIKMGKFKDYIGALKNMYHTALRENLLLGYTPPGPMEVLSFFKNEGVPSVEYLKYLVERQLFALQRDVNGSEFDVVDLFYENEKPLKENTINKRVADRLRIQMKPLNYAINIEHQLKGNGRCDITCSIIIDGDRKLVPIEAKCQWNTELFTAPEQQLYDRYASNPDASQQGIYLVYWFGPSHKVAGRISNEITSADMLLNSIKKSIPKPISNQIEVFVLDLQR
jgi:hypothetical protein